MQNFIYWFQKQAYLSLNGIRKTSKGMIFRLYDDQRFIYMQKRKMVKKPKYCKKIRVFHLTSLRVHIIDFKLIFNVEANKIYKHHDSFTHSRRLYSNRLQSHPCTRINRYIHSGRALALKVGGGGHAIVTSSYLFMCV